MSRTSAPADPRIAAVILAAGGSSRLGRSKQLLRYRGVPLILRAIRLARQAAGSGVIVVIGDQRQRLRSVLRRRRPGIRPPRLTIVGNAHWGEGLASSLRAGIRAVPPGAEAVLMLLVDQARLTSRDIERLVSEWRKRPSQPAAARYRDRIGVPAVIPRRWFRELATLDGDVGAREVLRRLDGVAPVEMPTAAFDVDTPADAAALGV
jgi:molybdenum cofactor cytidylyltransferase